jgi:predicted amidohydrolase
VTTLRLGLLQYAIERVDGVGGTAEKLDRLVSEAGQAGAELLVLPEYALMEAVGVRPEGPDVAAELAIACEQAEALLAALRALARRHEVWLLGGSLPMLACGVVRNRAPLIGPDGRTAFQDKHVMTRFETEQWGVGPGAPPAVFATPWGTIGVAICYDLEFPTLVRAQVEAGAWLILSPTSTDTLAGFNRVRLAAQARALENQCYVAIAPTVGAAPWLATLDENRGYAAVFGPVDRGFPDDGVIARGAMDESQWVLATLDPERLSAVRADGAVRNHRDWPSPPPPCPVLSPEVPSAA